MSEQWTAEKIAALRAVSEAADSSFSPSVLLHYIMQLGPALDEIERLQARVADCQCGKFPVHLTAARFQKAIEAEEANQRRELLLRECLEFARLVEDTAARPHLPPEARQIAARIRAELGDER